MIIAGKEGAPIVEGVNWYGISADVALSHDPNLIIERSDADTQCSYGGKQIDYTVKFQNTGEGPTRYIKVTCFLDDKVNLNTIDNVRFPSLYNANKIEEDEPVGCDALPNTTYPHNRMALWSVDHDKRTITFEMHDIELWSSNDPQCVNINATRSEVSFSVNVRSDYVFGDSVRTFSEIVFDHNAPIETNIGLDGL